MFLVVLKQHLELECPLLSRAVRSAQGGAIPTNSLCARS